MSARLTPKGGRDAIVGREAVKARVRAVPEDGAALAARLETALKDGA